MRNFLWKGVDGDGGDHLVLWKLVARAKIKGGLCHTPNPGVVAEVSFY